MNRDIAVVCVVRIDLDCIRARRWQHLTCRAMPANAELQCRSQHRAVRLVDSDCTESVRAGERDSIDADTHSLPGGAAEAQPCILSRSECHAHWRAIDADRWRQILR